MADVHPPAATTDGAAQGSDRPSPSSSSEKPDPKNSKFKCRVRVSIAVSLAAPASLATGPPGLQPAQAGQCTGASGDREAYVLYSPPLLHNKAHTWSHTIIQHRSVEMRAGRTTCAVRCRHAGGRLQAAPVAREDILPTLPLLHEPLQAAGGSGGRPSAALVPAVLLLPRAKRV